jgi:hypothetical protein
MIERFRSGTVAVTLAAALLLQCAGCSGSKAIPHPLDRYDDRSFAPAATFYSPVAQVREASLRALKNQGCTILATDSISHTIRAEIRSAGPIAADSLSTARDGKSHVSVLGILGGLVVLVGVVILAILTAGGSSGTDDATDSAGDGAGESDIQPTGYIYDISLMTSAIDDSTSDVELDIQKIEMADSLLISSAPFENIYFNYPIFDEIQRELGRVVEDTTVVK